MLDQFSRDSQYQAVSGYESSTIRNFAWISRRFAPPSHADNEPSPPGDGWQEQDGHNGHNMPAMPTRHENLSYRHHREVAALVDIAPAQAEALLDRASAASPPARSLPLLHSFMGVPFVHGGSKHGGAAIRPLSLVRSHGLLSYTLLNEVSNDRF